MGDPSTLRRQIAQRAARQWGHVTRTQLLGFGMAPSTIGAWLRDGRLVQVHSGVYAFGYRRVEPVARAMAAVLAAGPGAVLSHDSALALWDLRRWPSTDEVIAPRRVRRPDVRAHRSITLGNRETTTQLGVPVTRVARALRDMGPRLTARQRTRLANTARLRKLLTAEEFEVLVHHRRNPTRSGLEDDFQRWIERHGLPQPITGARLPSGHEVDALYPEQRVIVEVDDFATHGDPATFASDRERDAAHAVLDYRTVRLIRERLTGAEARRLQATLAA